MNASYPISTFFSPLSYLYTHIVRLYFRTSNFEHFRCFNFSRTSISSSSSKVLNLASAITCLVSPAGQTLRSFTSVKKHVRRSDTTKCGQRPQQSDETKWPTTVYVGSTGHQGHRNGFSHIPSHLLSTRVIYYCLLFRKCYNTYKSKGHSKAYKLNYTMRNEAAIPHVFVTNDIKRKTMKTEKTTWDKMKIREWLFSYHDFEPY